MLESHQLGHAAQGLGGVDGAEHHHHGRRGVVLDKGALVGPDRGRVGLALGVHLLAGVLAGDGRRHRKPLAGAQRGLDTVELLSVGGLHEHLDLAAARQADIEGIVVGDAVAKQERRPAREHLLGAQGDVGLHAATGYRADHLAARAQCQARPERARGGAAGIHDGGQRDPFARTEHPPNVAENLSHAANGSSPLARATSCPGGLPGLPSAGHPRASELPWSRSRRYSSGAHEDVFRKAG